MSISLDLQCETFSPLGNISGRGIQKILGTPNLDRLRLVIRETVQNTWDARLRDGEAPPRYCAGIRSLDTAQRELLLGCLLADIPPSGDTRRRISELHKRERIYVLEISDYGTSGLGGPVRANMLESEGEVRDFVDFFRNVGSPRDIHHGGGTYGYGKSSLYLMSRCRTILAYSRTHIARKPVSRIFGAAISDPFAHERAKYTGRYWWGQRQSDQVVDPVEGVQADRFSRALGMPPRSREDFGTTVLIVDPDFDHRSSKQAIDAIRESLLWYFWPKMIPRRRQGSPMKFEVTLDQQQVALPALKECHPLGAFAEAFNQVVVEQGGRPIECQRPIQLLGHLGLAKVPLRERVRFDTGDDSPLIPAQSCHVALMRPAELVVKYLEGPALPTDSVEYGGVFICNEEVEEAFAAAEPPAHDDWIPDNLTGRDKTFVRVALRRIRDIVNEYAAPPQVAATAGDALLPLGAFGDALGGLLLGQPGQGLSEPPSRPRASKQARLTAVRIGRPKPVGFSMVRRSPCALFKVDISGRPKEPLFVVGEAQVVVEGGGGTLNPVGVDPPTVVAWLDEKGGTLATGARLELQPVAPMSVFAAVSIPPGCAVALNVEEETPQV